MIDPDRLPKPGYAAESPPRQVFYVSDRTGHTAETFGDALLKQFRGLRFERHTFGFIDTLEQVRALVARIDDAARCGRRPVVISTIVDDGLREAVEQSAALVIDLFDSFIAPLEQEFGSQSMHVDAGSVHLIEDYHKYQRRMEALGFAQQADDGLLTQRYAEAEVILLGVSRSGKTPTCLFMAMQYGTRAANYPIAPDDFSAMQLPAVLEPHRQRLYGLTINPEQLSRIHHERRPNSQYASIDRCYEEVTWVKRLYQREGIPFLDSTNISVEEISAVILAKLRISRSLI